MSEKQEIVRRHLERERRARKAAEELLEEKSYQLYQANLELRQVADQLEERVAERTVELLTANAKLQEEIAERTRIEQELARARDLAVQASRLKSEFLATMSHEIRTPMNGITGMTELLLETELTAEQQEFATVAHEESMKLLEIINSILDLSKIEAGKIILEQAEFALTDEVWGVLRLLAPKAESKGITLRYSSAANIPTTLLGDAVRIRQVLTNLIGNAVKFTHSGQVTVTVSRCTGTQAAPTEIEFLIEDTGIGMPPAVLDGLFHPFRQADSSTTRRYGGTGLGLAITKRLVDLMKGELRVESTPNVGSKFTVIVPFQLPNATEFPQHIGHRQPIGSHTEAKLPLLPSVTRDASSRAQIIPTLQQLPTMPPAEDVEKSDSLEPLPNESEENYQTDSATQKTDSVSEHPTMTKNSASKNSAMGESLSPVSTHLLPKQASILVVEDYPNNQRVILAHLKKLGYCADIADNGRAAIDNITQKDEHYQLILMDWQMPIMDGLEATRLIRKIEQGNGHHIPIIGMTANAIKGDRERCLEAGMDDYLAKPVRREELSRVLATWLP